jgi:restriction system protein
VQAWHALCVRKHDDYLAAQQRREQTEQQRREKLAAAEAAYAEQCKMREAEVEARNTELARLVNNLAFDVPEAIEEYVSIVLSNSVYPDAFQVSHDHTFDLASRELTLTVTVPDPSTVPVVKEFKYVKAKDEITSTNLPVKAQKDRYAGAVWQVAVRTLHEVFEADRAGKIQSIALTVGTDVVAAATGRPETVPLVAVAADRATFNEFDLANVVPQATLTHLGAALSKSPFDLTPADTGRGVRVRGQ